MDRRKKAGKKEPAIVYWHGGAAGRAVGEQLIPGTSVPGISEVVTEMTPEMFAQQRPDYVHITVDRDLAFDYAVSTAKHTPAALYIVKPLGHLEHDPDYPRGVSHRCRSAVVLSVEPDVITAETAETGAHLGYSTWDDGSSLYDVDGYPLPNRLHQHFGVTASHLRSLGYGADFEAISARCVQTVRKLHPNLTQDKMIEYQQKFSSSSGTFGN